MHAVSARGQCDDLEERGMRVERKLPLTAGLGESSFGRQEQHGAKRLVYASFATRQCLAMLHIIGKVKKFK